MTARHKQSWVGQRRRITRSIVQRKRLRFAAFADLAHLAERLHAFVAEWNQHAHHFNWSSTSVAKVMAQGERPLDPAA